MYGKINREELRKKIDAGEDIHILEVLSREDFDKLHIKGAEHLEFSRMVKEAKDRFAPHDVIIVYCKNKECDASPSAAQKLTASGFTNVYDYEEGKEDWVAAGYPVEGTQA